MSVSDAAVAPAEGHSGGLGVQYRLRLRLFPADALQQRAQLSFAQVAAAFEKAFVPLFQVRSECAGWLWGYSKQWGWTCAALCPQSGAIRLVSLHLQNTCR